MAFPTETVYGLGADVFRPAALAGIYRAKGRPADNPLIAHLAHRDQTAQLTPALPHAASVLMEAFFPGPLTLIVPRHPSVPSIATAGLDTIALRMPDHDLALAFLKACGTPVAAPSANRSGRPSPTTWQAVASDLDGRIDAILCGDPTRHGLESTVVDCTGGQTVVLRAGTITLEALQGVDPTTVLLDRPSALSRRSPGTRHRHYAPDAQVVLVDHPAEAKATQAAAYIGLTPPSPQTPFSLHHICTTLEAYAQALYGFFRMCDAKGLRTIYCQRVPTDGLGLALMDRLNRAAKR